VAQAPLAQELKKLFAEGGVFSGRRTTDMHEEAKKFFVNYFKQIALVFGGAWNGRKYSIRSAGGAQSVHSRLARRHPAPGSGATPIAAISARSARVIAPWAAESAICGSRPRGSGSAPGTTVDSLAKELPARAASIPEGAAV